MTETTVYPMFDERKAQVMDDLRTLVLEGMDAFRERRQSRRLAERITAEAHYNFTADSIAAFDAETRAIKNGTVSAPIGVQSALVYGDADLDAWQGDSAVEEAYREWEQDWLDTYASLLP